METMHSIMDFEFDTRKTQTTHFHQNLEIIYVLEGALEIEIETETLEQVAEAVEAGADIIMLDNMTPEVMKQAVALIDGRAQTECSGNITKENIARICEIGVDFVSSGALTHSAPILDISMKHLHAV